MFVGGLPGSGCADDRYRTALDALEALELPLAYTPGAGDWLTCEAPGGDVPGSLERLRRTLFADPPTDRAGRSLPIERQGGSGPYARFVENVRWTHEGVVFATVHVIDDGGGPIDATTTPAEGDGRRVSRLDAAIEWVRDTFRHARASEAPAVVVAFHADPAFEEIATPRRLRLEPFVMALRDEVEDYGGPVLVIHAGEGGYTVDRPLQSRVTRRPVGDMTRLRLPVAPEVGWVRVTVRPAAEEPFTFEPREAARWRLR